jgi:hypothetical protein
MDFPHSSHEAGEGKNEDQSVPYAHVRSLSRGVSFLEFTEGIIRNSALLAK